MESVLDDVGGLFFKSEYNYIDVNRNIKNDENKLCFVVIIMLDYVYVGN